MNNNTSKKAIFKPLFSINPHKLKPRFSINNIHELPNISGIYFVIRDSVIIYIGKSRNINKRWNLYPHHIESKMTDLDFIVVVGVELENLVLAEKLLIEYHEPLLNRQYTVGISSAKKEFTLMDLSDAFYLGYCKGVTQGTRINRAISNTDLLHQINNRITSIDIGLISDEDPVSIATINAVISNFNIDETLDDVDIGFAALDNKIPKCPSCISCDIKRNGKTVYKGLMRQKYKCKKCGKTFSE